MLYIHRNYYVSLASSRNNINSSTNRNPPLPPHSTTRSSFSWALGLPLMQLLFRIFFFFVNGERGNYKQFPCTGHCPENGQMASPDGCRLLCTLGWKSPYGEKKMNRGKTEQKHQKTERSFHGRREVVSFWPTEILQNTQHHDIHVNLYILSLVHRHHNNF